MTNNPLTEALRSVHPGELLREDVLPALGLPKTKIADLLKISRQTLYDILDEKQPVTAGMAVRLGKLCGDGPWIWLAMQRDFDLAAARRDLAALVDEIPTLAVT